MMFGRLSALLLGGIAALTLATPASALGVHVYTCSLSPTQEVPPTASSATGACTVTLDDVTGSVTVSGSYGGLTSNATLAHIHGPAPVGVNAGILIGLTPSGGTSGTVSGGGTLSPANITNMLNGLTYVNVHTVNNGGGEVRGQIVSSVPSMSWEWMAALGVLAAAGGAFVLTRRPALAS